MPSLVIFDLDGTLAAENVSFAFSKFLYKRGKIALRQMLSLIGVYIGHTLGLFSIEYVHSFAFRIICKNESVQKISSLIDQFLKEALPTLLRPQLVSRLLEAKARGSDVWLLSSSPDCIVEPIAAHLGIKTVEATRYQVKDGRYAGIGSIVTGKEKKKFLEFHKGFSREEVIAYSDSVHDLPLLEAVGTPIVVCPDRVLKKVAQARRWQILEKSLFAKNVLKLDREG